MCSSLSERSPLSQREIIPSAPCGGTYGTGSSPGFETSAGFVGSLTTLGATPGFATSVGFVGSFTFSGFIGSGTTVYSGFATSAGYPSSRGFALSVSFKTVPERWLYGVLLYGYSPILYFES